MKTSPYDNKKVVVRIKEIESVSEERERIRNRDSGLKEDNWRSLSLTSSVPRTRTNAHTHTHKRTQTHTHIHTHTPTPRGKVRGSKEQPVYYNSRTGLS